MLLNKIHLYFYRFGNKARQPSIQLYDPYSTFSICRSPYIPDAFSSAIHYIHQNMLYGKFIDSFPHFNETHSFQHFIEGKIWSSHLKCIQKKKMLVLYFIVLTFIIIVAGKNRKINIILIIVLKVIEWNLLNPDGKGDNLLHYWCTV